MHASGACAATAVRPAGRPAPLRLTAVNLAQETCERDLNRFTFWASIIFVIFVTRSFVQCTSRTTRSGEREMLHAHIRRPRASNADFAGSHLNRIQRSGAGKPTPALRHNGHGANGPNSRLYKLCVRVQTDNWSSIVTFAQGNNRTLQ